MRWRVSFAILALAACRHNSQADAGPNAGVGVAANAAANAMAGQTIPEAHAAPPPGGRDTVMKSYAMSYANPSRNSHVVAPPRRFEGIARAAVLDHAPRFVLTNESGSHVAIDYGDEYDVRLASGAVASHGRKIRGNPMIMESAGLLVDGDERDFAGRFGPASILPGSSQGDRMWALQVGASDVSYVRQRSAEPYSSGQPLVGGGSAVVWSTTPVRIEVSSARFFAPDRANLSSIWDLSLDGSGCGAISGERRIALAMFDRRFFVYDANRAEPDGTPRPLAQSQLDFEPYDISLAGGGIALLSKSGSSTLVYLLDWQGKPQWHASIGFSVGSPPIEAAGGRIYLVGHGFAAAEKGAVLWSQTFAVPTFATAVGDGSVLLAVGAELRSVGWDGAVRQTLHLPDGDAIVTPPAVAADGAVWVATAKALYLAR